MKITKQRLKQIIREELETFYEAPDDSDIPVTTMDFGDPETIATSPKMRPPHSPVTSMETQPEEMTINLEDVDPVLHGNLKQLSKLVAQQSADVSKDDPRLAVYKRVADTLFNLLAPTQGMPE